VTVTILGPGEVASSGGCRAGPKLSQGETRFVSYVTLFAAAGRFISPAWATTAGPFVSSC